ncbi:MAG: tetratricopeptide repeat protein, partial [Phycisphaerae bacterium]
MKETTSDSPLEQKLVEIQQLLDFYVDRRLAGEAVSDDQILQSHPELMPELESELGTLKTIERARRRARLHQDTVASGSSVFGDNGAIEIPREKFPGYELRGEIHRGGQGVVHRALHLATKREVAIKVLYGGSFAGGSELARFEREVQILASLRHPHIVTVHDSGVAPGGSLYFAMDFIDGAPLDLHFDTATYPAATRLHDIVSAFVPICDAVNAAHLRGVIHRDLKPSNIRVDKDGRPQVLDFGLAKLIDFEEEADKTLNVNNAYTMTAQGQFVGSVPWASPEQASGEIDLDVRTDVYSIGVLLYQLTTGAFPYDVRGPIDEVISRIRSAPPASPQSRNRQIPTDLETIVLKALAKERERRYQSAGELRDDLKRFLANEPVEARRDSGLYLVRKLIARHRITVGVAVAFFLLMTSAAIVSSALYAGQVRERSRAEQQTEIANRQRDTARAARAESDAVLDFMQNMLGEAGTSTGQKHDVTMRSVLDAAAARIEHDFEDQPLVRAALHDTVGAAYTTIALYDEARPHLESALALRRAHLRVDDPQLSESMCELASLYHYIENRTESTALYQEALALRKEYAGPNSAATARAHSYLASAYHAQARFAEAESEFRRAIEIFEQLEDNTSGKQWGTVYTDFGHMLMELNRIDEAEENFKHSMAIWERQYGPVHTNIAGTLQNLGAARFQRGDLEGAMSFTSRALAMQREFMPHNHPSMASLINNVGALAHSTGDYVTAEKHLRESLDIHLAIHKEPHRDTARAMTMLGVVLQAQQQIFEADAILQDALKMQIALLGENHPDIGRTYDLIASGLEMMRRLPEALEAQEKSLRVLSAALPAPHPVINSALVDVGSIRYGLCDLEGATEAFLEAIELIRKTEPLDEKDLAGPMGMLADVKLSRGDAKAAEEMYREVLAIREKHHAWHWTYPDAMVGLGGALLEQDQLDEAREWLERA